MIRRRCSFKKYAWNVVSGKSPLIINNSERDRFRSFSVIGKSEQVTTTGTQLFDISKVIDSAKVKVDGNKIIVTDAQYGTSATAPNKFSDYFPKTEIGKTYILSFSDLGKDYIYLSGVNTIWSNKSAKEITQEILDSTIVFYSLPTKENVYSNIMLNEGSTAKPYEPYTGGKASPSPDYPQEIKNVGKWNEEKQKYEVDVRVTGNNILNMQIEPDTKGTYQGWKVGDGKKKITLSIIDKGNNKDISNCYFGLSGNGTDQKDGVAWLIESGKITKTKTTSLNPYVTIFPSDETAQRKILERFDIQCEFGEIKTEYQPYKEQTLTLTSDRPLTKWDRLVEQNGQIGWLYQSAIDNDVKPSRKDLFPYELSFYKDHGTGVYTYYGTNDKKEIGYQTSLCKQFKNVNGSYTTGGLFHYSDQPSLKTQYFSTDIPTVEEFKQWMENNPLTMLYKTKTPEFVPLPQAEQDSIRSLISYSPTTIITVDGGEVDPIVEVLCAIKEMM